MTSQTLTIAQFQGLVSGRPLAAAAGIGTPERFFESLRSQGFQLCETLALPDHHTFTTNTLTDLHASYILITAKDAIKCEHIHDERIWVVEVTAVFSDSEFADWLNNALNKHHTKPPRMQH